MNYLLFVLCYLSGEYSSSEVHINHYVNRTIAEKSNDQKTLLYSEKLSREKLSQISRILAFRESLSRKKFENVHLRSSKTPKKYKRISKIFKNFFIREKVNITKY